MTPAHTGRIFTDYAFVEDLGGGSFGRVLRAQHLEAGFLRACKCVSIRSKRQFALVETEVALMRRLDHRNLLRLYESYYDGDRNIYLVLELCTGGSLAACLEQLRPAGLEEARAASAFREIFSAVLYCHRRGIVHRDLKPENVLFAIDSPDSPVKVIDFGLSDLHARLARRPALGGGEEHKHAVGIGTPHYMAPEIYRCNIYDEKVDIFACGCMLAEVLTGVHPFFTPGVDDLQSIRERVMIGEVDYAGPWWDWVSADAKDLAQKLLLVDRKHRLTAVSARQHPWLCETRPVPTVRASIFASLRRFASWHVLGQAAGRVLARQLDEAEMGPNFLLMDLDGDGTISADELQACAGQSGVEISTLELAELMQAFKRGQGQDGISWTDFQAATLDHREALSTKQVEYVFRRFCAEGCAVITPQSLQEALTAFQVSIGAGAGFVPASNPGEAVVQEELERVFVELGANGRRIEFPAFRKLWP